MSGDILVYSGLKYLKEIIYLTTVTAGFPRSIDAAQALREVFATSQEK